MPLSFRERRRDSLRGPRTGAALWYWFKILLLVAVLKWGFLELYNIPSASMEPVLHGDPRRFHGDYVAVNKLVFGPRVPFTNHRIFPMSEPKRWDIVVFDNLDETAEYPTLIKRVVGLPGERVLLADGQLHINGEAVAPPPAIAGHLHYTTGQEPSAENVRDFFITLAKADGVPTAMDPNEPAVWRLIQVVQAVHESLRDVDVPGLNDKQRDELVMNVRPETLAFLRDWLVREYAAEANYRYGIRPEDEYSVVPPGHYYVLGDNSLNSKDSRFFGWVSHDRLYGRAFAIVLPFDRMRDLSGFSQTLWGNALLFGLPLIWLCYTLFTRFVAFSVRAGRTAPFGTFQPGERVLISRLDYGLVAPITGLRIGGRPPRPGEILIYRKAAPNVRGFKLCAAPVSGGGLSHQTVRVTDHQEPGNVSTVSMDAVLGRAIMVWWPPSRRRMLTPPASGNVAPA